MIGSGMTHGVVAAGVLVDVAAAILADTFTNTVKIKDFSAPEESTDTSEDAYIDEVSGYKEFVPGMKDPGEISLTLKWDEADTGQIVLNTAFEGDGAVYGQIVFTDGNKFTYKGVVTGRGIEVPKNETITRTYKIKLSGKPSWT